MRTRFGLGPTAAFGFHAEALKIVRAIKNTFERACMLIVINCHPPELDRQEAESETVATIQAIEDESTRIWLLRIRVQDGAKMVAGRVDTKPAEVIP